MIKIAEKDDDYAFVYSEDEEELEYLISRVKMVFKTTYKGCTAILVRKEKKKERVD